VELETETLSGGAGERSKFSNKWGSQIFKTPVLSPKDLVGAPILSNIAR